MDGERILASFVAALAINELLHMVFQIWSARHKVSRLHASRDKRPYSRRPVDIDMLAKTLGFHTLMFVIITGLFFGIFLTLQLSIETSLLIAVGTLLVTYSFATIAMDGYRNDIVSLLNRER
jgi:hypothetical protein